MAEAAVYVLVVLLAAFVLALWLRRDDWTVEDLAPVTRVRYTVDPMRDPQKPKGAVRRRELAAYTAGMSAAAGKALPLLEDAYRLRTAMRFWIAIAISFGLGLGSGLWLGVGL